MKLFLIRHGQSSNNALPEYKRVEDPGLTELGQLQAQRLGAWSRDNRPTRLLVSPFRRTLETARPVHQTTGLQCEIWIDLHERGGCYSGYQPSNFKGRPGMSGKQIRDEFPETELVDAIGDEGWWRSQPREDDDAARQRAVRIAKRLKDTFGSSDEVVACVMHADFKQLLVAELMKRMVDPAEPSMYLNASVTTFEFAGPESFQLVRENCVQHLGEQLS